MKRIFLAVLLIVGIGLVPISYGMPKYIPDGSKLLGVYWGLFDGDMVLVDGIIHIELYQTPKGNKLITGPPFLNLCPKTVIELHYMV